MNMKWVTNYASLFTTPAGPARFCYLPIGTWVEATGRVETKVYGGALVDWVEVIYVTAQKTYQGWIYAGYLEEIIDEFAPNVVAAGTQTPNPNDAGQDIIWLGQVQYNLCGEFCVAFLAGDSIDGMLTKWQPKAPSIFSRIFPGGRSRPTGAEVVQSMLEVYGKVGVSLSTKLQDTIKRDALVSPGRFAALAKDNYIIVFVKIDAISGNLRGSGVSHWICVTEVVPDGVNRGWVTFYNPFPNQMQRESWATFAASMGLPYGLVVKR